MLAGALRTVIVESSASVGCVECVCVCVSVCVCERESEYVSLC